MTYTYFEHRRRSFIEPAFFYLSVPFKKVNRTKSGRVERPRSLTVYKNAVINLVRRVAERTTVAKELQFRYVIIPGTDERPPQLRLIVRVSHGYSYLGFASFICGALKWTKWIDRPSVWWIATGAMQEKFLSETWDGKLERVAEHSR